MPKLVFLATDIVLYLLLAATAFYAWHALRTPTLRQAWRVVARDPAAMSAAVVLGVFLLIAHDGLLLLRFGFMLVLYRLSCRACRGISARLEHFLLLAGRFLFGFLEIDVR